MEKIPYPERKNLPDISAVYLVGNDKEVLYIGSTIKLKTRILTHHKKDAFAYNNASYIQWIPTDRDKLANEEEKLVRSFIPILNGMHKRGNEIYKNTIKEKNLNSEFSTSLRDRTFKLYITRSSMMTNSIIEKESGISQAWLKKFGQGKIENPGVCTIETLFNYLLKNKTDYQINL